MMFEKDIKEAVEYLQQYPYLNKLERLAEAILNCEETENRDPVITKARWLLRYWNK